MNNIFFEYDKSTLTNSSKGELNQVYAFLKKNPALKIEVAGHTDSMGSEQYNRKLSLARAKSVKQYLVKKGIESNRIKVAGYGEDKPIATNSTDEGREKNRRVEFEILQRN
jgi:outer membrane protein OmpA-like peptidoglycan-associated protein